MFTDRNENDDDASSMMTMTKAKELLSRSSINGGIFTRHFDRSFERDAFYKTFRCKRSIERSHARARSTTKRQSLTDPFFIRYVRRRDDHHDDGMCAVHQIKQHGNRLQQQSADDGMSPMGASCYT